jgi:hypothetical protein
MIGASTSPLVCIDLVDGSESTDGSDFSLPESRHYQIHIRSTPERLPQPDLLSILESLLPIQFTLSDGRPTAWAGELIVEDAVERKTSDHPCPSSLSVPYVEEPLAEDKLLETETQFADDPDVPFPYRGRSLRSKIAAEPRILRLSGNEKVLASTEMGPVWVVSKEVGGTHFRSGFTLPRIPFDGCLPQVLDGNRFIELLPLLHWIRETCSETAYHGPPLRACFTFDDPNLHWPRYGFVDFREIAQRASKMNYHVAFATIPLDGWFTHRATAEIFKENKSRLSLLVHGNNHTRQELAQNYPPFGREHLLKQAIQRIERIERKAGFPISRLMVPPHGACSEEMLAALGHCGFEAASISHGSLRAHNKTRAWTRSIGYLPSELVRGCPVLPRWGMSGTSINTILLAAFLRQPIILRGHHQDLKEGIELLDQLAGVINGLGSVSWPDMTGLSWMNYEWRSEGDTFRARLLGRKANVQLPAEARRLIVESPANCTWDGWQTFGAFTSGQSRKEEPSVSGLPGRSVLVEGTTRSKMPLEGNSNGVPVAALFRRCLTEGRDRFVDPLWR